MNAEIIINNLQRRLVRYRGRYQRVLDSDSSLDKSWLSKFANGRAKNPTIRRLEALDRALTACEESDTNGESA